jgi:hypothetical protein
VLLQAPIQGFGLDCRPLLPILHRAFDPRPRSVRADRVSAMSGPV